MIKKMLNIVIGISILVYLYFLYIMLMHPPTDGSDIAQLQIRSAYTVIVIAVAGFIRLKL
ncbi:hypothetical protein SAMN05720606_111124 [Paenibacillus polysaccharolyticus]|uniref:Uncharacterized protein n=2 Tax=Paenibacillus TaxID=44249 RepID=A0A1G5JKS0_9BACL|nr:MULTISPECIES: hypothetical protein [Paenibacillus]MDP9701470.1 hypothetical protein [Paenibacillus intestini]SCY88764.1 hypothetical protein SAMN05720606_111124 [Paenibacillus polysaccharolyticus]